MAKATRRDKTLYSIIANRYLSPDSAECHFEMPLAEFLMSFDLDTPCPFQILLSEETPINRESMARNHTGGGA